MKVETNLKAGGLLQDAARSAENVAGQVTGFVGSASEQATNLTNTVVGASTSAWDYVTGALGL
jgi:hypothetical protein